MHKKPSALRNIGIRGASLVEMMVALPILICLVVGIFEFARIIVLRNILATSVSRTASLAAVVADLDAYPKKNEDPQASAEARAAAINRLRETAEQLPLSTMFSAPESDSMAVLNETDQAVNATKYPTSYPTGVDTKGPLEVILPEPKTGQTLDEALKERPIILKLHARIKSTLPFIGPFDVVSSTAIFREPKTYSSQPIAIDCQGNKFELGAEPDCPCPTVPANPQLIYDYATGTCRCAGDLQGNGQSCSCPGNLTVVQGTAKCACQISCGPTEYREDSSCTCQPVICPENMEPIPYTLNCRCKPESCNIHEKQDQTSCQCSACPNLQVRSGLDPTVCKCEPIVAPECATVPDSYLDMATCSCKACPAGKTGDSSLTGCVCKPDPTCTGETKYMNSSTCECITCPSGQIVNSAKNACVCRGEYSYLSGYDNMCHCSVVAGSNACAAKGQSFNVYTCSCEPCPKATCKCGPSP